MSSLDKFETHISIAATDSGVLERVRAWSDRHQLKWTHILLDSGRTPSQPMVTVWGTGLAVDQLRRAEGIVQELGRLGASVVRVKTEADVENRGIPVTTAEVPPGESQYFEHHVKLLLESESQLDSLKLLAATHDARLSRNARRIHTNGSEERFVTQRVFRDGKDVAQRQLESLLEDLEFAHFEIVEIEQEYVVYDSNLDLDAGWR